MRPVLNELGPQFERATSHTLVIQFDVTGVLKRQIDAGEPFDVTILTTPLFDELVNEGKIVADTRVDIAHAGLGVIVRAGGPTLDISSADAFKRAMLNTQSISYIQEGASTSSIVGLFERLGIAEQMQAKTKLLPARRAVAHGEAELGLLFSAGFEPMPGAELLVLLPPELQTYVGYTAGVGSSAQEEEASKAFLNFLQAPAAGPVFKAKYMEPIIP
jgi:molybdate transport system substrate-binding protein